MSEHYFSRKPQSESDPVCWDYTLRGHRFKFKTDRGVFSKREVDFGSRLLIETFEPPAIEGNILDVGCGYGHRPFPCKKHRKTVHMIDINERALSLAEENASLNEIENVVIYESDRLTGVTEKDFAAIVTNPPIRAGKKVVYDIFEQSFARLREEGELWVGYSKEAGTPLAVNKLTEIFQKWEL